MSEYNRLALVVSDAPRAQEAAEREFRSVADWVPLEEADAVVVLGGDGFMLQTLHAMLDTGRIIPA
ncbi:MAG: NAD(+) kinase, partial [Qipengyuania citrea]